jgi:predicted O-methyltransferase YrrM
MLPKVKKLIPRAVKESIKARHMERKLRRALDEVRALKAGEAPSAELLARCGEAWGDDGFRAVGGYLEEVTRVAATTEGPVLEIGSGLTTLLMGLLAGRRGVRIWTFEHLPEFYRQTCERLERFGIENVRPVLAPLKDYGEFSWYSSPDIASAPRDFRLVIADGPPDSTKGGRYGLLPVMREHLAPDAVIMLDDAERPKEQAVLEQWREQYNLSSEVRRRGEKAWAVCALAG